MFKGNIQKRYLCLYPNCKKTYVTTDGLRKHCKKYHMKWLKGKKPTDYGYDIPKEYEGYDYVRDYMAMVRAVLAEEDNDISPSRETFLFREETSFITPVLLPIHPPDMNLGIVIDFYTSLFCSEII